MKRYVKVLASFSEEGELTPVQITWKDGRKYDIDRVLKKERRGRRCRYHVPLPDPGTGGSFIL